MYSKLLNLLYMAIVVALMLGSQGIFALPTGTYELLMISYICLSSYRDNWRITVRKNPITKYVWDLWVFPQVLIWIYSMAIQLFGGYSSDYLVHTTTFCVRMVLYSLVSMAAVNNNKEKAIDYLLYACIISYIPAWVKFISAHGLVGSFTILFAGEAFSENLELEVHTLTYIFGFISVYYLYRALCLEQKNTRNMIVSIILMLSGVKRIVIAAFLGVTCIILVISLLKAKRRISVVHIGSVIMIFVAFGYIFLIKSGIMEEALKEYRISDNFRFNFWNHFRSRYTLTPTFWGYGISYSHRIMQHEWMQIQNLKTAVNIHNDILGYYLGLGFIGFLWYWYIFFYARVKGLSDMKLEASATMACVVSIYYFIVMMTSNEGMAPFPYSIYFMTTYAAVYFERKQKRVIGK